MPLKAARVAAMMIAMSFCVATAHSSCPEDTEWLSRNDNWSGAPYTGYWEGHEGSVRRDDDGYAWDSCTGETGKVWLWLQCVWPRKGFDDENIQGVLPYALLLAQALPQDPAPLNVVNPLDWPELIVKGITGTTDHFRENARVLVNGTEFEGEVVKEGEDWSFITTEYELVLEGEAFKEIRENAGTGVDIEVAAGKFRLVASFAGSSVVDGFFTEIEQNCPLTESERTMTPEDWEKRNA